jgi:hypothetical protein
MAGRVEGRGRGVGALEGVGVVAGREAGQQLARAGKEPPAFPLLLLLRSLMRLQRAAAVVAVEWLWGGTAEVHRLRREEVEESLHGRQHQRPFREEASPVAGCLGRGSCSCCCSCC